MIGELGQLALCLALALAVVQAITGFTGAAHSNAGIMAMARGSALGGRQPKAATSSRKTLAVPSVSSRIEMPRSAARALILSSTSVMLRT